MRSSCPAPRAPRRAPREPGRRLIRALALPFAAALLVACSDDSAPPLGTGNMTTVDVDATTMPSTGDDDGGLGADSPFAPVDGPYGTVTDAYAPIALCSQCGCEAGTYCYGGTPTSTLTSCDQTASAGLEVGCHAIPADCGDASDVCVCLLEAYPRNTSCYPVCAAPAGGGFVVYCPH